MKKILFILCGLIFSSNLFALPSHYAGNNGSSGYFLTPTAEMPNKNEIRIGFSQVSEPEADFFYLSRWGTSNMSDANSDVLHLGGISWWMGEGLEGGWSTSNVHGYDWHQFTIKKSLRNNPDSFFGRISMGGTMGWTASHGNFEEWGGFIVAQSPYSRGDFNLGVSIGADEFDATEASVFGNFSLWFSPRLKMHYEFASSAFVTKEPGQSVALWWQTSPDDPLWISLGATTLESYGCTVNLTGCDNDAFRTDETMFTFGFAVGINSYFDYEEEDELVELFETFGKP
tara:strand:+ start:1209 stop:2066 length:858 start_codon:yes stop_codon:yes gene_type:complete